MRRPDLQKAHPVPGPNPTADGAAPSPQATPSRPAKRPFRQSPNQQRLVGRTVVWTLALCGLAFWIPHVMR
jgi:hypothetical protein